jgi:hypothetical protein
MPVVHSPESEYSKEMEKWNTPRRLGGMRPDGFEQFPSMVYRALEAEHRGGKVLCGDPLVAIGDPTAETFTRQCQLTVNNQEELDRAMKAGWCGNPSEAVEIYKRNQENVARAAAEEAFRVNRMVNEPAKREFHEAQEQAEGYDHVPDPPAPKKAGPATRITVK